MCCWPWLLFSADWDCSVALDKLLLILSFFCLLSTTGDSRVIFGNFSVGSWLFSRLLIGCFKQFSCVFETEDEIFE